MILCLLVTAAGCKKFLEVEPESQYDVEQAFSDVSNATTAVLGAYDDLQGDNGYGIRINLYYPYDSDEAIVSGNIDNGRRGIGRYQLLLSNTELTNPFNQLYRGLEKANLCIEQIPLMPLYSNGTATEQMELRRLHGEALTLRAQYLFELIRNWGDVPAPMVPSYRQPDLFIPQSNRDSTYDKLIADLATAKGLVPWRTEVTRNERITKGAVMALRAKLALFRGGYSLRTDSKVMERRSDYLEYYKIARDECAELMQNRNQHTLNPSFEDVWRKLTSFTADPFGEIIFEVGAGGGNSNSDSRMGQYNGPSLNAASRYGQGGGGLLVLPNYFYAFNQLDTRREVSITYYSVGATNLKSLRRLGELTDGKFRRDWRNPLLPGTVLNLGYNWPLIRFADVLLMFAEADNELNNGPSAAAIAAFEEVRTRAFAENNGSIGVTPTDRTGFFNAIVNERYLEFGGEAIRKYDLIRWNLLSTKLEEARQRIVQIRDASGPYASVPEYIYWRNNGEEIQFFGTDPFNTPTQVPNPATGWTRTEWRQHLISGATIDNLPLHQGIARFFTPNKSELFPFTTSILQAYAGRLKQNPNY
ncbi:RagB/SusD family nutrient uptake outer membrane protein [Desertivirga xinjiangensis]|uniref:RagB/SusD family nutrient uptake outer membrane protein n=1 Tax=Desertivirga xinjiangensis TaxID=539206 RepID=UPI00210EAA33|nr:RagB/SusD family nutrient uptake outer membrane protein [Pedobacter xinjiangensis]